MDTETCSLSLGLLLGALATGLLYTGWNRQREARAKIKKLAAEKKKAGEAIGKAAAERKKGLSQLPGALLLILLGLAVFLLAFYLLSN